MNKDRISDKEKERELAKLHHESVISEICRIRRLIEISRYKENVLRNLCMEDYGIFDAFAGFIKFARDFKSGAPYMHTGRICYIQKRMTDTAERRGVRIGKEELSFIYLSYVGNSQEDFLKRSEIKIYKNTSTEKILEKTKKAEEILGEIEEAFAKTEDGFFTKLCLACLPVIAAFSEEINEEKFKNKKPGEWEAIIVALAEKIIEDFGKFEIEFIFYSAEFREFFEYDDDAWEKNAVYCKNSGTLFRNGITAFREQNI